MDGGMGGFLNGWIKDKWRNGKTDEFDCGVDGMMDGGVGGRLAKRMCEGIDEKRLLNG